MAVGSDRLCFTFTIMNYTNHYNSLINKSRLRGWSKASVNVYVERHHIIPKCMGGSNTVENIVCLTYREHRLAHLLLSKIYPGNYKLLCAVKRMYDSGKFHKRDIGKNFPEYLKIKHVRAASEFFTGKPKGSFTAEHRKNLSLSHIGHKDTEETKIKKSNSSKGHIVTEETRSKNRLARLRQTNGGDKRIQISGLEYKSIGEAERITGISRFNIWRRIKSDNYNDYSYL